MKASKTPTSKINFSIVIAVYERHDELHELLQSLTRQKCKNFEVIVVDDGSTNPLDSICKKFTPDLKIKYYYKSNSGPGLTRNYGMSKAQGDYFVFLDSDTVIPENYICAITTELEQEFVDFYGGSDGAHVSFDDLQKAINYSMTSFLTTGGIRGGEKKVEKFQPRSFNMGLSREAFEASGGFGLLRVGEDPDLTMRLWEQGFKSKWFPKAMVFHKRRTSLSGFAKQVKSFGIARPILNQLHPSYTSLTFWFPSVFLIGFVLSILFAFVGILGFIGLYLLYFLAVFIFSSLQNKSLKVGILSVITTGIQFFNYGVGFLISQIKLNLFGMSPQQAFPNHFYQKK